MSRAISAVVLALAVLIWAGGASVILFAESWWRVIGVVCFALAIPLAIWAGRALRQPKRSEPSR